MTFDDDYCQFVTAFGLLRVTCKKLGFEWPPPEEIQIVGGPSQLRYVRNRFSAITDEERAGMAHICRAAEYLPGPATEEEDLNDDAPGVVLH